MYNAIEEFLRTFNVNYPLLWAVLVMAVVAVTSLALYLFWELVLRLFSIGNTSRRRQTKEPSQR